MLKHVIQFCKLPIEIKSYLSFCSTYKLGKIHVLRFQLSTSHCTKPLKLVHSNLWDPAPISSFLSHLYYIVLVDDFLVLVDFIHSKPNVI